MSGKKFTECADRDDDVHDQVTVATVENSYHYDERASVTTMYAYTGNNPVRWTDTQGTGPFLAIGGAVVGGLVSGIGNAYYQYSHNGGHLGCINWGQVGAWTAGGAATGGLAGLTFGGSLLAEGEGAAAVTGGEETLSTAITNPIPSTVVRVIPGEGPFPTLGAPGSEDVFVTNPQAIEGMTPAQISERLGIPPSNTYTTYEFPTPSSIASPVFRTNPGFVGGGLTNGGAPEFVIPNNSIPQGTIMRVIRGGP